MENESQSIQPTPPVPIVIKKSSYWQIILLLLILGILIIAGAIFLGIENGKKNISSEQSSGLSQNPLADTPINPTNDQTSDWETYTNTVCLYSIKYPHGWLATNSDSELQLNNDRKNLMLYPSGSATPNTLAFELMCDNDSILLPRSNYSQWIGTIVDKYRAQYKSTKESTTAISDVSAVVLETEIINPPTPPYTKQLIFSPPRGDGFFIISIMGETKQESSVFDQIISTFKFTN